MADWRLVEAGIRVQTIKTCRRRGDARPDLAHGVFADVSCGSMKITQDIREMAVAEAAGTPSEPMAIQLL